MQNNRPIASKNAYKKGNKKVASLSTRAWAAKLLVEVLDKGQSLSALLPEVQKQLPARDFPLLQELCFGVCRVLPRLENIVQKLVKKPLKGKTRIVHCLMLVGLYQILYTRIPEHAAVGEVVNACQSLKVVQFKGLLNGVLRHFLREKEDILAVVDKHWQTLHPEWFVNKLKKAYPNWRDIIEANNQKPPMWLRINAAKIARQDYAQLLRAVDVEYVLAEQPAQALALVQPSAVQSLPYFQEGWFSVQDLHAQWSATLLEPQNSEWILDACSAPGGKTTHLLELAPQADIVALDIEENRLARVKENLARLQQKATVICGDASQPETWMPDIQSENKQQFDKILLDAPCSATGVIRRHPDIKWLRQESDIEQLVSLQASILEALWKQLKPNGVLLYATCSVLPQENADQIRHFLQAHNDAELLSLPFEQKEGEIGKQFLPTEQGGDGFYYAKLRKIN